jgi:hypothetical protein
MQDSQFISSMGAGCGSLTLGRLGCRRKTPHWSSIMSWFWLPWNARNWTSAEGAAPPAFRDSFCTSSIETAFSVGSGCSVDHHGCYIHGRHFGTTGSTWNKSYPNYRALGLLWGYRLQNTSCRLACGPRMADLQRGQQLVCVLSSRTLLTSE